MRKTFKIFASLSEESKEGWVWMPPSANVTSDFVKIKNPKMRKSIICERRILDENYLKHYISKNKTRNIEDKDNSLIINAHYRNKLGGLSTTERAALKITEARGIIQIWLRAPLDHPSPFMRLGIKLGIISVVLGFIGLFLGIISIFT